MNEEGELAVSFHECTPRYISDGCPLMVGYNSSAEIKLNPKELLSKYQRNVSLGKEVE